jgi:hypothetical protein
MTLSNPDYLPKATSLNIIARISFYSSKISQWGSNFNMASGENKP